MPRHNFSISETMWKNDTTWQSQIRSCSRSWRRSGSLGSTKCRPRPMVRAEKLRPPQIQRTDLSRNHSVKDRPIEWFRLRSSTNAPSRGSALRLQNKKPRQCYTAGLFALLKCLTALCFSAPRYCIYKCKRHSIACTVFKLRLLLLLVAYMFFVQCYNHYFSPLTANKKPRFFAGLMCYGKFFIATY